MAADRLDKGKGKAKDPEQDGGSEEGGQQTKEVRRPPPLPAVKGTMGAIESPSRRSFYTGSPTSSTTVRGNHSPAPSYDFNYSQFKTSSPPRPAQTQQDGQNGDTTQQQQQPRRDRPVFRSDPTMTSCFDRLRVEKKEEIRSLFGA